MVSTLHLPGDYHQHELSIQIDERRERTVLSSEFVGRHRLPFRVVPAGVAVLRVASGPLRIPTGTGRYVCSFPMEVGFCPQVDVVLGRDWMSAIGIQSSPGAYLADHASAATDLPPGFRWESLPTGEFVISCVDLRLLISWVG